MSSTLSNITGAFQNFGTSALNALSAAKEKAVQGASYVHDNATVKNVAIATATVALASAAFYAGSEYSTPINDQFANAQNSIFSQPAPTSEPTPEKVVDTIVNATKDETKELLKDISQKGFAENAQELATDMKNGFVENFNWASENFPKHLGAKYDTSVQYVQKKYSLSAEAARTNVNYGIAAAYTTVRLLGFTVFGLPNMPRSIRRIPKFIFRAAVI